MSDTEGKAAQGFVLEITKLGNLSEIAASQLFNKLLKRKRVDPVAEEPTRSMNLRF